MMARHEYRDFPANPEMTQFVRIPVNRRGEPLRSNREWKALIADAVAKPPQQRSPAARAAVRREVEAE
jgi:hypothetical protein